MSTTNLDVDHKICLTCTVPTCSEEHPDCSYQNAKPRRTVAADITLVAGGVPLRIQIQRRKWASNAQRQRDRLRNSQEPQATT
jgi:hypothetical protein